MEKRRYIQKQSNIRTYKKKVKNMIEKYKSSWEYDCSSTPEAWTHNCYILVNFVEGLKIKINELVDAVNKLKNKGK